MFRHVQIATAILAAHCAAADDSVSASRWVATTNAEGKVLAPSRVTLRFDVPEGARVTNAWVYAYVSGGRGVSVNGGRELWGEPIADRVETGGYIKGHRYAFTPAVRAGRNELAFTLRDRDPRWQGLIVRGEAACADGTVIPIHSSTATCVGAAAASEPGLPVLERGDVSLDRWGIAGPVAQLYTTPAEWQAIVRRETANFPEKALLAEPDSPNAKVVYSGNLPAIESNGELLPPFFGSGLALTIEPAIVKGRDSMFAGFRKAGVKLYQIGLRDLRYYKRDDGSYDFSRVDFGIRALLARVPDARFVLGHQVGASFDHDWLAKHPDELCGYAVTNKSKAMGDYSANPVAVSIASRAYRAYEGAFLKAFGAFARSQPWGRRLVITEFGWGPSADGMPAGCHAMPDTGLRMTEAFRRFLAEKYKTDAALQAAWGDAAVTLATATVPDAAAREGSGAWIRDLADPRDRRLDDYYTLYHREYEDTLIALCRAVKEALPGSLAGYCGAYVTLNYTPEGMTAACERSLQSPWVDYLRGTVNGNFNMDGIHRNPHSLVRRYGKFCTMEIDDRVHRAYLPGEQGNPKGVDPTTLAGYSPARTRATITKAMAAAFFYGCGAHFADFGKSSVRWFDCPEALEPLATAIGEWRARWKDPTRVTADVAVVFDAEPCWRQGHARAALKGINQAAFITPRQALNFSGFATETYEARDFLKTDRPFKAVVFLNLFHADAGLRARLREKVRRPGTTAIWCHAPGLSTDAGWSDAAMEDLTGLALKATHEARELAATDVPGGGPYKATNRGGTAVLKDSPRVWADDARAEVLSRYTDDKTAALVRKTLPDGSVSVFAGIPVGTPELWAKLLADAGCHAYTKSGFCVRANSHYLQVFSPTKLKPGWGNDPLAGHLDTSGRVTVRLPRTYRRAVDAFTGEVLGENVATLDLSSADPKTWIVTEGK